MFVKFYIAANFEPLKQYGVLPVHLQSHTCIKDACYDNPKTSGQIFIVLATTQKLNHILSGCWRSIISLKAPWSNSTYLLTDRVREI